MKSKWRALAVSMALLGLMKSGQAWGQTTTGAIRGEVVDAAGSGLPGVQVTVSSAALLRPRSVVTGQNGEISVPGLPVGMYTVEAQLAPFEPARAENVRVLLGGTTALRLTLRLQADEKLDVYGDVLPLVDPTETGTGGRVTYEELLSVPTARDPWAVLALVPGIQSDRVNVGGTQSGQQANFAAKGDPGTNTMWNIDGVTITDMAALGSSSAYYDFGAIEEIQISTGGNSASMQTGGIGINIVTKRGSNELHGSLRGAFTNDSLQQDNISSRMFEHYQDNFGYTFRSNSIRQILEVGGEAGGPVVKDRLWLWGAANRNAIDTRTSATNAQNPDGFPDDTLLVSYSGKLSAQLGAANEANVFYQYGLKDKKGRNAGTTRPPETTWNQDSPTHILKLEDQHIFGSSTLLALKGAYVGGDFSLIPQGGSRANGLPATTGPQAILDGETGEWSRNFVDYETSRPQYLLQLDGSHFRSMGKLDHDFKFGFAYRDTPVESASSWDGGAWLIDNGGGNFGAVVVPEAAVSYEFRLFGAYLSDTISSGALTLDLGVRFDRQEGFHNEIGRRANPLFPDLFPALAYPGSDGDVMTWNFVSPRVGASYQLGDRTLLKANYALYADQLGGADLAAFSPLYYQYAYLYFTDTNGNRSFDPGSDEILRIPGLPCGGVCLGFGGFDPDDPSALLSVNEYDPGYSSPKTHEAILGAAYQIARDTSVGVSFTYRRRFNTTWAVPLVQDAAGGVRPVTLQDWERSGSYEGNGAPDGNFEGDFQIAPYSIPRYELAGVSPAGGLYFTNRESYTQRFLGAEILLQKRFSGRWSFGANLALQKWTEHYSDWDTLDEALADAGSVKSIFSPIPTISPYGNTANPLVDGGAAIVDVGAGSGAFQNVFLNSEWQGNVRGSYLLPRVDVSLAGTLQLRQGYPTPFFHRAGSPFDSTTDVLVGRVDDHRMDTLVNLDLHLGKELRLGRSAGIELAADLFNATNAGTVLQHNRRINTSPALLMRPAELLGPRLLRFSARLKL
jgi:hypothetical protein